MWRFYFIGFLSLLLFDTFGQISFKYTSLYAAPFELNIAWIKRIFSTFWMYLTLLNYLGSFGSWMYLLKRAPIGPAFAISHMQVVSVMFISVLLFGEHITIVQIIGATLILMGIIVLAVAEKQIQQMNNKHN
ncbi:DMT family transporter [Candidatus Schmidhempelia bombi]|jgi:multidrug transporter EmrE-like cation transporter|uniref:EamA family transporter n=1 Tax=Candidatus Schmidhempelia bombi str. Bimp TaxID=1387197 RepID=A0AB94ICQ0_9GAMM|nr:EamA family transporter [Candidatus Schmidhempelia bombi]TEA27200.1 EamA family transporter [Candidatus Schmidhempelia bombi str. Bimp]